MILLSDWANFKKTAASLASKEEDVGGHDDEGSLADIIDVLVENLQLASRHSQAAKTRSDMQTKLGSLAAQVTDLMNNNMVVLRSELDRQLTILFSPLLNETLEVRAVEDFCNGLVAAARKDASRHLVISAPRELQVRLAAKLAETGLDTSIVVHDGQEISTTLEATEITTEIGKWKADLQRLLS